MIILKSYITMMPLILGGICNMLFTKSKLYKENNLPIDNYKMCKDGNRLLGDNKTWIGFYSMIVFCIICQVIWGIICKFCGITNLNEWYSLIPNTLLFNVYIGFLIGLSYVLFELPNSFIKRRLNISPGKTGKGLKGCLFFIIDQIDSLLGVFLVLVFFAKIGWLDYLRYLLLGFITHIAVNWILYSLRVRRNI